MREIHGRKRKFAVKVTTAHFERKDGGQLWPLLMILSTKPSKAHDPYSRHQLWLATPSSFGHSQIQHLQLNYARNGLDKRALYNRNIKFSPFQISISDPSYSIDIRQCVIRGTAFFRDHSQDFVHQMRETETLNRLFPLMVDNSRPAIVVQPKEGPVFRRCTELLISYIENYHHTLEKADKEFIEAKGKAHSFFLVCEFFLQIQTKPHSKQGKKINQEKEKKNVKTPNPSTLSP